MAWVPIPAWTAEGVLPPVDAAQPTGPNRAPYPVSMVDLVARFAASPQRCEILSGLLRFRAALYANGREAGFQWLDGSFMEDVETIEGRPPDDIDVVSFVEMLGPGDPARADPADLEHDTAKQRFKVDSYIMELDAVPPRELALWSAYWYSMWAHRRDQAWKGFLQVELDADEDALAADWLAQNGLAGAGP